MFLFVDPLYLVIAILGYILLLVISLVASKLVSSKILSKFSLYTSMIITSIALLIVLTLSIGIVLYLTNQNIINSTFLTSILIWVIISNIVSYLISPYIINFAYKVRRSEFLENIIKEEFPEFHGKIKIVEFDGIPNAFAYGNFISGKYIAVSTSLINSLDINELKAVIGHELGHHTHRDSIIMLLFGMIPSVLYFLGYFLIRSSLLYNDDKRNSNVVLALAGFAMILLSVLAQILVLAFSRLREYYADQYGAKLTSKLYMQSALAKIHLIYTGNKNLSNIVKESKVRTLFIYALTSAIANPILDIETIEALKRQKEDPIREILSTHPPISKRLKALDNLM